MHITVSTSMHSYNQRTNRQYVCISIISVNECMHTCMYVCMHLCVCVRARLNLIVYEAISCGSRNPRRCRRNCYIHTHRDTHRHVYIMYTYIHAHVSIYTLTHTHTIHIYMYMYMCVCVCVCVYIYIRLYGYL